MFKDWGEMGGTEERVYKWACGNFEGRGRDMFIFLNVFYWLILEREKRRERDRNIDLLCLLVKHLLFDSCMCPDPGWNPQPWCLGMTLTNWARWPGPVHFLDCSDGFTGAYICPNLPNCTIIYAVFSMSITLQYSC